MSNKLKWIAVAVVVVILLLVMVPFLIPVDKFRPEIEAKASAALGRKVELGKLNLSLLTGSLGIDSMTISDDPKFNAGPFLTSKSVKVGVQMIPLIFSKQLNITEIAIDNPQVMMLKNPSGQWNFSSIGGTAAKKSPYSSSADSLSIGQIALKDGQITLGNTNSQKRSVYTKVNLKATDVAMKNNFPVDFFMDLPGGGDMKIFGKVGPIDEKDSMMTPQDVKLIINKLNLATTGVLDPSLGLGGIADVDSTLVSSGGEMTLKGRLTLTKALLVAGGSPSAVPMIIDFDSKYSLKTETGLLNPSTVKIGNAVSHLTGTYKTAGDNFAVDLKVVGDSLPAKDLETFLPAIGVSMPKGANLTTGTLSTNLHITGPTNHLVTDGTIGLYNATLAGFDLSSQLTAISSLAGLSSGKNLQIEKATTSIHMAPNGLKAENFDAVLPAVGILVGAGTVDGKNNLDFNMVATLQHGLAGNLSAGNDIGKLMGGGTACKDGGMKVPFRIEGTTASPRFLPDAAGIAAGMLKSQLGCAGGSVSSLGNLAGAIPGAKGAANPADTINQLGGLFGKKKKP
jgi:AsmA protein